MDPGPRDPVLSPSEVAHDIRLAFADARVRPEPPWVRTNTKGRFEREAELMASNPGQPTPQFLLEFARRASTLRPKVERWFWRALLLASVDIMEEHGIDRVSPTLFALQPDPGAVLDGRTDHHYNHAQAQRLRFTPAQRVAVARFLRLVLEQSQSVGHWFTAYLASRAIAWCWNDDPVSTHVAQTLRAEARTYTRPCADDPAVEALIVTIEHAFSETPPPERPEMGCGCDECATYTIEFAGADWRTLSPKFVDTHAGFYGLMTPATFRYYLPVVLCHTLGPGSEVDTHFHLVHNVVNPSDYRDARRARILTFSEQERAAVAAFLCSDRGWDGDPEGYMTAIYDFWDPQTAGIAAPVCDPPMARMLVAADIRAAFGVGEAPLPPTEALSFLQEHADDALQDQSTVIRWFLPAMLLVILETPGPHMGFWKAVSLLTPGDNKVRHMRSDFTGAQRVAVARFLRLTIEEYATLEAPFAKLADLASNVIASCWHDDPVSTRVAQTFRKRAVAKQQPIAEDAAPIHTYRSAQ